MATLVLNDQASTPDFDIGSIRPIGVRLATSTFLRTSEPDGYIGEYEGSGLTYGGDGLPTGGTLNLYRQIVGGGTQIELRDLSVPAATFSNWVRTGDNATAFTTLFGGADSFMGSAFNDTLAAMSGDDTIAGAAGNDWLDGNAGNDSISGGEGNDFIRGLEDNDQISAGNGDDDANGNTGTDTVHGDGGADYVRGGQGDDLVYGDAGNDFHVNGNIGNDQVFGGAGNDTVFGGQGSDTLYGDDGADWLSGDLGNDIVYGGAGGDRFLMRVGGGTDWVGDFNAAEGDRVQLAPGTAYTVANSGGQAMIVLASGDGIGLAGVSFGAFSSDWVVFA
jgi:Ca2+-binding RTX toxin-like protein